MKFVTLCTCRYIIVYITLCNYLCVSWKSLTILSMFYFNLHMDPNPIFIFKQFYYRYLFIEDTKLVLNNIKICKYKY